MTKEKTIKLNDISFSKNQYLYEIESLIDCHTHILPGIDDGARNIGITDDLMEHSRSKNIKYLCFTPHFYPDKNKPEIFFEKRKEAYDKINDKENTCLGAEVAYFSGISNYNKLKDFCLGNSNYILIEMPFEKWTYYMVDEIINIERAGLVPIIAHYERFLKYHNMRYIKLLQASGCIIQTNSEYILNKKTRRKAMKHFNKGFIDIIASDCHNLETRYQTLPEALVVLLQNAKENYFYSLINRYEELVEVAFSK